MSYRVYVQTFGCQMNEYDTELVRSLLKDRGFAFTEHPEQADVVLMNTCAIRENAHNRVYGHLAEWKAMKQSRQVVIGVLGCMAQNLKKELMESQPVIDVLAGPDSYRQLPDLLTKALERREPSMAVDLSEYETYESILPERKPGVNAWIAIMRGCDNFCSFCVVPYTRGRERSRPAQGILEETHALAAQGYKQVTLLGQNVNSYRSDEVTFARLLSDVADVPGIERVRFTSPHPKDFPSDLIEVVAHHPNVCRQVHLPLQAGSDRILDLMGRSYTRVEYRALAAEIRKQGDITLSTDIIAGFCTETHEEFLETHDLVREIEFQSAYIFKYSERKSTIAYRKFPDDVPDVRQIGTGHEIGRTPANDFRREEPAIDRNGRGCAGGRQREKIFPAMDGAHRKQRDRRLGQKRAPSFPRRPDHDQGGRCLGLHAFRDPCFLTRLRWLKSLRASDEALVSHLNDRVDPDSPGLVYNGLPWNAPFQGPLPSNGQVSRP